MTLGINGHRWRFLAPERANAYVDHYERLRTAKKQEGWKRLVPATTQRQFATARAILDRLHEGKQGVLLADDVGLGKTTVAALCALVFAGSDKRVRILAPNEMMARRWRQELEIHIEAVASFARHLDLEHARKRLGQNIRKLHSGAIAVSTHTKATRLACDLLIIDEAHRTRSDHSVMARQVRRQRDTIARVLVLTATPFSIDPNELAKLLVRIGGKSAEQPMKHYAKKLDDLWRGRNTGSPEEIARELVDAARAAVDAMRPYVIRHSINDLSPAERRTFGNVCDEATAEPPMVPDDLLEAMLRTDRALALGQRCNAWDMKRRNDPRYHVAAGKLVSDLSDLLEKVARCDGDDAALASHHARLARKQVRSHGRHPKIADTVETTRAIVGQGEKVLIFCDHHLPAEELTKALADELRWPAVADDGIG
ncbi:MAG TPA: DEAD/DEAH box helicase family protein, partial [Haliangium sp.]|nr:DEAD/DEAH box helicase family protein [Haliangium sp.]